MLFAKVLVTFPFNEEKDQTRSICHQKERIHLSRGKEIIGLSDNHPVNYRVTLEMLPVCILCFVSLVSEQSTTFSPSVSNVLYPQLSCGGCVSSPRFGHRILSTTQPVHTEDCPKCECPK